MAIKRKLSPCPEYIDLLVDYSDGELAANEQLAVAEHIISCADCQATLAQLDSSRDRLLNGFLLMPAKVQRRSALASDRSLRWTATVAIIGFMFAVTLWTMRPRMSVPQYTKVESISTLVESIAAPKLSPHDALWQIAVVEQQARLQASLDLWPKDDSYNEQRERDRRLMATFQSLADANSSSVVP